MRNFIDPTIACTGLVEKYIGTAYDNVKLVADNMDDINELADALENGIIEPTIDYVPQEVYDAGQAAQDSKIEAVEEHAGDTPNTLHLPAGGNSGQVPVKQSATDGDVVWTVPQGITKVGESISGSGGTIEDVVNATVFTSGTSEDGRLVIGNATLCTIAYENVAYEYMGPNNVEIGAGVGPGTHPHHTCVADDFFVSMIGEHNSVAGRSEPDAHPLASITGLQTALDGKENTFTKNTAFNKDFGNTSTTVCVGNDARLSDTRDPNAHEHAIDEVVDLETQLAALTDAITELQNVVPMTMLADYTNGQECVAGNVVYGDSFTMCANKLTTEAAIPFATTNFQWAMYPDEVAPAWAAATTGAVQLLTGARINTTTATSIESLRVWIPYVDPGIRYLVLSYDSSKPDVHPVYLEINPINVGWFLVTGLNTFYPTGVTLDIYLVTQGAGTTYSEFTGEWDLRDVSANPAPFNPPSRETFRYYGTNAPDTIYWNIWDRDLVNRTADIGLLRVGDKVRVDYNSASEPDPLFAEWTLTEAPVLYEDPTGEGGNLLNMYDLRVAPAIEIPSNEKNTRTVTATMYLDRPLDYVRIVDGMVGSPSGSKGLFSINGIENVVETDDSYGIDVRFQNWSKSDDWDFVAFSKFN